MAGDDYEPNRVLGIPVRGPRSGGANEPPDRRDEEPQRVLGFPVDLFSGPGRDRLRFPVQDRIKNHGRG